MCFTCEINTRINVYYEIFGIASGKSNQMIREDLQLNTISQALGNGGSDIPKLVFGFME